MARRAAADQDGFYVNLVGIPTSSRTSIPPGITVRCRANGMLGMEPFPFEAMRTI